MKKFLSILGIISLIIAGFNLIQWFTIDEAATTVMQQQMAGSYLIYSGIMFLAGLVGLLPVSLVKHEKSEK